MKRLLIVLTLAAMQLGVVSAQTPEKSDIPDKYSNDEIAWARERTQMLDDIVSLTEEQRKDIMKINLRYADHYMDMRAKNDEKVMGGLS